MFGGGTGRILLQGTTTLGPGAVLDGVSLTVNEVGADGFSLVLIPHTQGIVHLHKKRPGDAVNLEADLIGKYVERLLAPHAAAPRPGSGSLGVEALARAGFL